MHPKWNKTQTKGTIFISVRWNSSHVHERTQLLKGKIVQFNQSPKSFEMASRTIFHWEITDFVDFVVTESPFHIFFFWIWYVNVLWYIKRSERCINDRGTTRHTIIFSFGLQHWTVCRRRMVGRTKCGAYALCAEWESVRLLCVVRPNHSSRKIYNVLEHFTLSRVVKINYENKNKFLNK